MAKRNEWSNEGRFSGSGGLVTMALALMLSIGSVAVVAQTAFEFEDPLDEIRTKIENQKASEPTPKAKPERAVPEAPTPETTEPAAAGNWNGVTTEGAEAPVGSAASAPSTDGAEQSGLPAGLLFTLGFAGLLALGGLLFWLLSRRHPATSASRKDRDLYAVAKGARGRRVLESGAKVTRNRNTRINTEEINTKSVASKAAKIISEQTFDDDYDDLEKTSEVAPRKAEPEVQDEAQAEVKLDVKADDPDTWRRPNLERLKASIREDWKSEESSKPVAETPKKRSGGDAFAELYGEDPEPTKRPVQSESPALDMLETFDEGQDDRSSMSVLKAAIGAQFDAPEAETHNPDREAKRSTREDAVRRVKALREALKAG